VTFTEATGNRRFSPHRSKAPGSGNPSCDFREPASKRQGVFSFNSFAWRWAFAISPAISRYLPADPSLNTYVITVYDDNGRARQELRVLGRWVVVAGLLSLVAGSMESDVTHGLQAMECW